MPSLKRFNTFGIDAQAEELHTVRTVEDMAQLRRHDDCLILGEGSNIVFARDIRCVWVNKIKGIKVLKEDAQHVWIRVGGGENWHDWVQHSIDAGWQGLENLSLIPGTVGAAPIQNIGAYGVEVASYIDSVHVRQIDSGVAKKLRGNQCGFGYRQSHFKTHWAGQYFIEAVEFKLNKVPRLELSYGGLRHRFENQTASARAVADTVIAIRREKLPDPQQLGNAGSFFKNPVVTREQVETLRQQYPDIPSFIAAKGAKIPAAWMIEKTGLKGHRQGDVGISDQHALVIVNYGAAKGEDVLAFARGIMQKIENAFGIGLEIEPRVIE